MPAHTIRTRATTGFVTAALALAVGVTPTHATADEPLFIDQWNETFDDPGFAEFISTECSVESVSATVTTKGRVEVYEHGVKGHTNYSARLENTDTGQYFVQSFANSFSGSDSLILRDDGYHEIHIHEVDNGLAQQFRAPGIGVIVRDAGSITFDITLVFDENDQLVDVTEVFDAHGPHPWAEQGFGPTPEQGAAICAAVGGTV